MGSCAQGCLHRAAAPCGGGGGPGWARRPMQLLFSSAFSSRGAPQPRPIRAPPAPSLRALGLPPSRPTLTRPPPLLPASLPPSLVPPPPALQDPARAAGGQAGRRPRRGEGAVAAAGGGQAGPAGNPKSAAAASRGGPGVCGWALPPRPCTGSPRDTPPSSAFFHLLLAILPPTLPILPPRLPPAWLLWGCQPPSLPAPLPGLSPPPACFSRGGCELEDSRPLAVSRAGPRLLGGGGEGGGPLPPCQALPSPTSPDGQLLLLHPVLAPRGPPRPARLGEGAGALSWAGFPLPRLRPCLFPSVLAFLSSFSLSSVPFSPPFSPFPFLPSPARPLLSHLSFLLAPGESPFWISWGPPRTAVGEGAVDCPLPPPQPHTASATASPAVAPRASREPSPPSHQDPWRVGAAAAASP